MLKTMDPESGRMAVVMPHGVLFRRGVEQKIRTSIIDAGLLEAVIGLPPNLFYNTTIPACILVCRSKIPEERQENVLFIDGAERFKKGKNQNEMTTEDVDTLIAAYRSGEDPDGEDGVRVLSVPITEIAENDYDLNIGRYIQREAEEEIEVSEALASYHQAREALRQAEAAMDERLKEAGFDA